MKEPKEEKMTSSWFKSVRDKFLNTEITFGEDRKKDMIQRRAKAIKNITFNDKYNEMMDRFIACPESVNVDMIKIWVEELEKTKSR